jgi:hypothetical protein
MKSIGLSTRAALAKAFALSIRIYRMVVSRIVFRKAKALSS